MRTVLQALAAQGNSKELEIYDGLIKDRDLRADVRIDRLLVEAMVNRCLLFSFVWYCGICPAIWSISSFATLIIGREDKNLPQFFCKLFLFCR